MEQNSYAVRCTRLSKKTWSVWGALGTGRPAARLSIFTPKHTPFPGSFVQGGLGDWLILYPISQKARYGRWHVPRDFFCPCCFISFLFLPVISLVPSGNLMTGRVLTPQVYQLNSCQVDERHDALQAKGEIETGQQWSVHSCNHAFLDSWSDTYLVYSCKSVKAS
jgi:hypothetical protein